MYWSPFDNTEAEFTKLPADWTRRQLPDSKTSIPYQYVQGNNPEVVRHLINYDPSVHTVHPDIFNCFLSEDNGAATETKEEKKNRIPLWATLLEAWMAKWRAEVPITKSSLYYYALECYCHRDYACIWEFFQRFGPEWKTSVAAKKNRWYQWADELSKLFALCPYLPVGTRLFEGRGRYEPLDGLPALKVGDNFRLNRMHSTSWHPDVALRFLPSSHTSEITSCMVIYEVARDAKVPAICIEAITPLPCSKRSAQEREIILPPFLRCTVTKKEYYQTLPQQLDDFGLDDFPAKDKEWKPCRNANRCFVVYVSILGM